MHCAKLAGMLNLLTAETLRQLSPVSVSVVSQRRAWTAPRALLVWPCAAGGLASSGALDEALRGAAGGPAGWGTLEERAGIRGPSLP